MEKKELTEQESLELISQMIKKTNKQMRIGSGDYLLTWGLTFFLVSLIANILVIVTGNDMWTWGYCAIIVGYPISWIMNHKKKTECPHAKTYMEEVIGNVWMCIGLFLLFYLLAALVLRLGDPKVLAGMLPLGILLPALGSYITGEILKIKAVKNSAIFAVAIGVVVLADLLTQTQPELNHLYSFPFCAIFSMIIPGYLINRQAKKIDAK